jgi:hypothetical protein
MNEIKYHERMGTRDAVETAIELSKQNKTESWDAITDRNRRARRKDHKVEPRTPDLPFCRKEATAKSSDGI